MSRLLALLCISLFLTAAMPPPAIGQELRQSAIGGGGGNTGDSVWACSATIGQPIVGRSEGDHLLAAGFWHLPASSLTPVFLAGICGERRNGAATLTWEIHAEVPWHFHVWREQENAARVRLTDVELTGRQNFTFTDPEAPIDELQYWLEGIDERGASSWYGPVVLAAVPLRFELAGCHPNPFNPMTTITFALPDPGRTRLVIHDLRGRLVRTLVDDNQPAGWHAVVWDGRDGVNRAMASGVYFARLTTSDGTRTSKLMLTR